MRFWLFPGRAPVEPPTLGYSHESTQRQPCAAAIFFCKHLLAGCYPHPFTPVQLAAVQQTPLRQLLAPLHVMPQEMPAQKIVPEHDIGPLHSTASVGASLAIAPAQEAAPVHCTRQSIP